MVRNFTLFLCFWCREWSLGGWKLPPAVDLNTTQHNYRFHCLGRCDQRPTWTSSRGHL